MAKLCRLQWLPETVWLIVLVEKQAYGFFILMRLAQPATIISVHKDEGQQPNILGWNKNMSDKGKKP